MKLPSRLPRHAGQANARRAIKLVGLAYVPLAVGQLLILGGGFHLLNSYAVWTGLALMQVSFCMVLASAFIMRRFYRETPDCR